MIVPGASRHRQRVVQNVNQSLLTSVGPSTDEEGHEGAPQPELVAIGFPPSEQGIRTEDGQGTLSGERVYGP